MCICVLCLSAEAGSAGARDNTAPWGRLPRSLSALLIKRHSAHAGSTGLFKASAAARTGETATPARGRGQPPFFRREAHE